MYYFSYWMHGRFVLFHGSLVQFCMVTWYGWYYSLLYIFLHRDIIIWHGKYWLSVYFSYSALLSVWKILQEKKINNLLLGCKNVCIFWFGTRYKARLSVELWIELMRKKIQDSIASLLKSKVLSCRLSFTQLNSLIKIHWWWRW